MQDDCPQVLKYLQTYICIAFSPFVLDYKTTAIVKVMLQLIKKSQSRKICRICYNYVLFILI